MFWWKQTFYILSTTFILHKNFWWIRISSLLESGSFAAVIKLPGLKIHCPGCRAIRFVEAWKLGKNEFFLQLSKKMLTCIISIFCQMIRVINVIFSHTQWVSVTLAITLCPSSLLSSLSLSAWTFLVFQLLLSNRCTDLLQILCGCS